MDDEMIEFLSKGKEDYYKDIDFYDVFDELLYCYKIIIILCFFEDFKLEEIVEIIGENMNIVKMCFYRVLKLMCI